jgi:hypothetical protein
MRQREVGGETSNASIESIKDDTTTIVGQSFERT